MKIEIGKVYNSNFCGDYKVLSKDPNKKNYYIIKFIKTNYIKSVRYDCISNGVIDDPYYPKIYGIGYLGEPIEKIDYNIYNRWSNMIDRCYNPLSLYYKYYGGSGVTVCDRWHCYAYFAEDFKKLPGYKNMINNMNIIKYNLDKDILQSNKSTCEKVYSLETCMLIPSYQNITQISIDNHLYHNNEFYNVIYHHGAYNVEIQINGVVHRIGRYKDPIVAANAANYARLFYGLEILNKNIPIIPKEIVNSQNIRKKQEIVTKINK